MAGIYIHFPFCVKRCYYCDFFSTTNLDYINDYLKILIKEIHLRSNYLANQTIETIYFGGGTPSLITANDIEQILIEIKNSFSISENPEITLEINPDDNHTSYFDNLNSIGINRLSIGAQSFDNKLLKLMNRRHRSEQIFECIESATRAGITNISIDLLYGLPGMNIELWKETLEIAFGLPIKHLSAYHLAYEKGTVFYCRLKKGTFSVIDEKDSWQQFKLLHKIADLNKFEHYEISNLSKTGYRSTHNSNYWNGKQYLGIGASAHSYNGVSRQWNYADLKKYFLSIENNDLADNNEQLTLKDKANDYILTILRTKNGFDFNYFKTTFGDNNYINILNRFQKYINSKHAEIKDNLAYLTLKGWFISDKIISDLMMM